LEEVKASGKRRIILWAGVQGDNEKAKQFYRKQGFRTLGQFDFHGLNYDMVLEL
ncbi:MAG: GNAT family N-acetyltransferase, partial [Bacteroidetes bacterium]